MDRTEKIARRFSKILLHWLGIEKMYEVVKQNQKYQQDGITNICASHDYCDANMAMDKAMEDCSIDFSLQNDEHVKLWNDAWSLAKSNEFYICLKSA